VQNAYSNARVEMEVHNRRFKVSMDDIIKAISETPNCWEFEGFVDKQIFWSTSDDIVIQGKNLGPYKARLRLPDWAWFLFSEKEKGNRDDQHPHVNPDGMPCYGNAAGLMTAEKGIVRNLEGLWAFLHQYNAPSAFRKLKEF
jgi:hypothetical protein